MTRGLALTVAAPDAASALASARAVAAALGLGWPAEAVGPCPAGSPGASPVPGVVVLRLGWGPAPAVRAPVKKVPEEGS